MKRYLYIFGRLFLGIFLLPYIYVVAFFHIPLNLGKDIANTAIQDYNESKPFLTPFYFLWKD